MAPRSRVLPASDEFCSADFGDERLRRRLMTIADGVATAPSKSFPKTAASDGELEGVYRFLGNGRVTPEKILAPHFAATVKRATRERDVLVVHDTTAFTFGGESPREGLGWIHKQNGKQGFFGHFALAVSGDGERRPLGLAGMSTLVRRGKPLGRKSSSRKRFFRDEKESSRWAELALAVHAELPAAIHVMDREGDSFDVFDQLDGAGARFVIRMRDARNRIGIDGGERVPVAEIAARQPVRLRRTVALSRRVPADLVARNKIHPPRAERTATLEVRSSTIEIPRPTTHSVWVRPRQLALNVVAVDEVDQPTGVEPVSWMLITTEPVTTETELERVVDVYRARWLIEEYFKALKTGCAFEKRQLESFHALMNALAVFSVVAWRLLVLRGVARTTPGAPADAAVTKRQLTVLQALASLKHPRFRRVQLPPRPTAQDVLMAIAGLGGHIKNNGSPGWQVLGRGYDDLLLLELGWNAREQM
jgi:hypothetical protein